MEPVVSKSPGQPEPAPPAVAAPDGALDTTAIVENILRQRIPQGEKNALIERYMAARKKYDTIKAKTARLAAVADLESSSSSEDESESEAGNKKQQRQQHSKKKNKKKDTRGRADANNSNVDMRELVALLSRRDAPGPTGPPMAYPPYPYYPAPMPGAYGYGPVQEDDWSPNGVMRLVASPISFLWSSVKTIVRVVIAIGSWVLIFWIFRRVYYYFA